MISLIFASHHIYTDRLFGFITIFRNTKASLKLLCNEIPPTQKRKHMMSFGQGFPLPFSRFFSLRILFCLPSIKPRRQYHHQEKEQRSVIFPSIHASNSWNSLFDKRLSVKFPEKHVKKWVVHFLLLFCVCVCVCVCGVVYGPGIRLDPFFRKVCNIYVSWD